MGSRAKAMRLNIITGWIYDIFALISGLILPRLILTTFGSEANGLTSSIAQYLSFSVLLRAGIGGATRAALYKPLAEKNFAAVSSIMAATQSFMRKVGIILIGYIAIIAIVFPLIAQTEYSWGYMFTMVLILGTSTFFDTYFGRKARILLQADQKYYIVTTCSLISYVAIFAVSVILIKLNASLMVVKIGSTVTALLNPLLLNLYSRNRYKLDIRAVPNNESISQRWNAFAHEMAPIINNNIGLILMSTFVSLKEISVYTVYKSIILSVKRLVETAINGINAMFGNMLAKKETEQLKKTFKFVEWIYFAICTLIYSITAIMIVPFIRIYTDSVTDVNYIRPMFALLITMTAFARSIRIPYQALTEAAGHFKQTQDGAIIEIIINISISIILGIFLGINGILLGACIAAFYRAIYYVIYSTKKILKTSWLNGLKMFVLYFAIFGGLFYASTFVPIPLDLNYFTWALYSVVVAVIVAIVILIITLINNRTELLFLIKKIFKKKEVKQDVQ